MDLICERRPPLQAARRPDEDQAGHTMRAGDRHLLGDVASAGGPQQHGGGDVGRIHKRRDICSDLRKGISRRGLIGVAVTAQVHRHGMNGAWQQRQQPVEGTPRLPPSVQKHNWRRVGRADRDIRNAHPGCQANPAHAWLLVHSSTLARPGSSCTHQTKAPPPVSRWLEERTGWDDQEVRLYHPPLTAPSKAGAHRHPKTLYPTISATPTTAPHDSGAH